MYMNAAFDSVCFKGSVVSQSARFVYLCLCKHADNTNQTCFPSLNRIAEIVGKSLSTIKRAIRELCKYGAIERAPRFRKDGGQTSNLYKIKECSFENIMYECPVEAEKSSIEKNQQLNTSFSGSKVVSPAPACTTGTINSIDARQDNSSPENGDDTHGNILCENSDDLFSACSEAITSNESCKFPKTSKKSLQKNYIVSPINGLRSWTKGVYLKLHTLKSTFFRKNEPGGGHE